MTRAILVIAAAAGLLCHSAIADEAGLLDQARIRTAIGARDGAALVSLLDGKSVTLRPEERDAARLALLEHLALLPAEARAERVATGRAMVALSPDDKVGQRLLAEQPEASATTALPETFASALEGKDAKRLIDLVLSPSFAASDVESHAEDIAKLIVDYAKPLPASDATANKEAYQALAKLLPDNKSHAQKAESYARAEIERNDGILRKLKKNTDEFTGTTFYQHPSKPRYADSRTYFLPYLGASKGQVWMRFVVHYTADDWLFIEQASFNIDGDIVPLPDTEWKRDNDSEIWEWTDIPVALPIRALLHRIADSKKTVVRFEGRQYFNNVTVSADDKQAIKDMFTAEEALKKSAALSAEKE